MCLTSRRGYIIWEFVLTINCKHIFGCALYYDRAVDIFKYELTFECGSIANVMFWEAAVNNVARTSFNEISSCAPHVIYCDQENKSLLSKYYQ